MGAPSGSGGVPGGGAPAGLATPSNATRDITELVQGSIAVGRVMAGGACMDGASVIVTGGGLPRGGANSEGGEEGSVAADAVPSSPGSNGDSPTC